MKNIYSYLALILLLQSSLINSQDTISQNIEYSVQKVYPAFAISKDQLFEAKTLVDLNKNYKPSWVKKYKSVEVSTSINGKQRTFIGENDTLTADQINLLKEIDTNSDVSLVVRYIPDNNLKNKAIRVYDCKIPVEPEFEAEFPGGIVALEKYLKENAIDKIPENSFDEYVLCTIRFTVNEEGQIINPYVFWPIENAEVEKILLSTVCNMPVWKPAEFADGTKVKQELVLNVGDMKSCVINMLNIRRDKPN